MLPAHRGAAGADVGLRGHFRRKHHGGESLHLCQQGIAACEQERDEYAGIQGYPRHISRTGREEQDRAGAEEAQNTDQYAQGISPQDGG